MKQLVQGQLIALSTEKNAQHESCELSFIWGKMRTVAQEIASQLGETAPKRWEERSVYM